HGRVTARARAGDAMGERPKIERDAVGDRRLVGLALLTPIHALGGLLSDRVNGERQPAVAEAATLVLGADDLGLERSAGGEDCLVGFEANLGFTVARRKQQKSQGE